MNVGMDVSSRPDHAVDPALLLQDQRWLVELASGLLGGDEHAAEDVAQETRLRAWLYRARDRGREGGWLARIARNVALRLRASNESRSARERRAAEPERLDAASALVARAEMQRAVADAVLALGEPYRSTVLLRYFDGLPPRAIATRAGVPVETVRTRLKRAHEQLRSRLDREYGERGGWRGTFASWIPVAGGPAIGWNLGSKQLVAVLLVAGLGVGTIMLTRHEPPDSSLASTAARSAEIESGGSATLARPIATIERRVDPVASKDSSPDAVSSIRGVVVSASETPVEGVRVIALDPNGYPESDAAHLDEMLASGAHLPAATTDARGTFSIEGLVPGRTFRLLAGGRGCINVPDQAPVAAGTSDAVLRVGGFHALQLVLVQRGGAPLPYDGWFGPSIDLLDLPTDAFRDSAAACAAGLPLLRVSRDRSRRTFAQFDAASPAAEMGPFDYRIDEAGFAPLQLELRLPRVTDEIPLQVVELDRLPDGRFGRLTVDVLGSTRRLEDGPNHKMLGSIYLRGLRGLDTGPGWEAPIHLGSGRSTEVRGVPYGEYRWAFEPLHNLYQRPRFDLDPESATIRIEGDDARIVLDLRDCGDVELEAVLADGTPYIDDNFQLHFVSIDSPPRQFYAGFQIPPHVVTAVLPGRYRVSLSGGGWLLNDGATVRANLPPFEIDVLAGATTQSRLVFKE